MKKKTASHLLQKYLAAFCYFPIVWTENYFDIRQWDKMLDRDEKRKYWRDRGHREASHDGQTCSRDQNTGSSGCQQRVWEQTG